MVNLKNYLEKLSQEFFTQLQGDEESDFFIHSEESQFIRFNGARVRQNTHVHQHELALRYQKNQRTLRVNLSLTLDFDQDLQKILSILQDCRDQLPRIDIHPQFVAICNHGQSQSIKKVVRPNDEEMLKTIIECFGSADMAGLYCSGPLRQISINSKGQFHYFENDFFFLDYSIYNGPKAAKGFFSTENWSKDALVKNIEQTKTKLGLLNLPSIDVPKGKHRVYLEPMALLEVLQTMSWGGFSYAALKQGRSGLRKLHQNELHLSEKFSLIENIGLGYVPPFNSLGELSAKQTSLIEKGKTINLQVSSATAQEYDIPSNQAEPDERLSSPEIKPGTLAQAEILKKLDTGLYLSNLHYLNWSDQQSARITGMTRYACFWVEKGEIKGPIADLRFDDSIYNLLGSNLLALTSHQELFVEAATYQKRRLGVAKLPGALIQDFNFTL